MITITGYTGPGGTVMIPEIIHGLPVTAIGFGAFAGCAGLNSVMIPNSITRINEYAFYGCSGLINVTMGDRVLNIGNSTFQACTSLGSITMPASVRSIGTDAFSGCFWLTAVYFRGGAPTLLEDAFYATRATLFYLPGTTGWETTSTGRPMVLWSGQFGVQTIQICGGLTVTGDVGKVYSIESVTDLAEPAESDWWSLEFLQLPASPHLWIDKAAPSTGKRFYRAVAMEAPTNMVFIPAGAFRMGSPTNEVDRYSDEGPQTDVIISRGFWMGKYEVTQGEYEELMGNNPSWFNGAQDPVWGEWHLDYGVVPTRPVEQVGWEDAVAYCAALTERERVAGRIPPNSAYRLPTEAEWEYACRAGTSTRLSYGDDPGYTNLSNYGWFYPGYGNETHPVGQKLPNPWGLYDMYGNVWEWCWDWYEFSIHGEPHGLYGGGISLDPQGLGAGPYRAIRGGARSASRSYLLSWWPERSVGFRVVLGPNQP